MLVQCVRCRTQMDADTDTIQACGWGVHDQRRYCPICNLLVDIQQRLEVWHWDAAITQKNRLVMGLRCAKERLVPMPDPDMCFLALEAARQECNLALLALHSNRESMINFLSALSLMLQAFDLMHPTDDHKRACADIVKGHC